MVDMSGDFVLEDERYGGKSVKNKKILYIQYFNPGAYPPLEHSSRILADRGWKVLFLGIGAYGAAQNLKLAQHANISSKQMNFYLGGWRQRLQYCFFCIWVFFEALKFQPNWIYASDPFSCLPALFLKFFGRKIIYHEHDSPMPNKKKDSVFLKAVWFLRKKIARLANICILPNQERVKIFTSELTRSRTTYCVWNCPLLEEIFYQIKPQDKIVLHYHGNANPSYIPIALLGALKDLPNTLHLQIYSYEVLGYRGHLEYLRQAIHKFGLTDRVSIFEAVPRFELMPRAAFCHVGIAFNPKSLINVNNEYLVGASNKVFDYMACGLALLVSDLPDWKKMYVDRGYGLACDSEDSGSIVRSLQWFLENTVEMKKMGDAGRNKIKEEWNYEKQFKPILNLIENENNK